MANGDGFWKRFTVFVFVFKKLKRLLWSNWKMTFVDHYFYSHPTLKTFFLKPFTLKQIKHYISFIKMIKKKGRGKRITRKWKAMTVVCFFFFFWHVHIKEGRGIRTSDIRFMRHSPQSIEQPLEIWRLYLLMYLVGFFLFLTC
jgi:hypothetical protein